MPLQGRVKISRRTTLALKFVELFLKWGILFARFFPLERMLSDSCQERSQNHSDSMSTQNHIPVRLVLHQRNHVSIEDKETRKGRDECVA